ncbi:MAG: tyrosine-type recombinase/integrase [Candidatus Woesearchaeota archaeon]
MNETELRTEIYPKRLEALSIQKKKLETWSGHNQNKELIIKFVTNLQAKGTGQLRCAKLMGQLRQICDLLKAPLNEVKQEDIEEYLATLNGFEKYTVVTKADYRRALKSFYKWYQKKDPLIESDQPKVIKERQRFYDYIKEEISISYKKRNPDYSNIITEEDAKIVLDKGCDTTISRALISVLHETGIRVGELLGIRIKDLETKEKHGMIRVEGKTGERRIPIIHSLPHLLRWLDDHPDNKNQNSLMWLSKSNGHKNQPLRHVGATKLIKRAFNKGKIQKKCNPHWFRHSRATLLAGDYSEAILCQLIGWTIGSKQVRTYVHIGGKQVEHAVLSNNGLQPKVDIENKPMSCVCGTMNAGSSKYCYKCGKPLSIATVIEDEQNKSEAINEAFELFEKIMTSPDLRRQFEEFKTKTNGGKNK